MEIEDLKIGDWVYDFESHISNGATPFLDYKFYKITGETKKYWVLSRGYAKIRKTDLKERGGIYIWSCFHVMDNHAWEMKKQRDDYMEEHQVHHKCDKSLKYLKEVQE